MVGKAMSSSRRERESAAMAPTEYPPVAAPTSRYFLGTNFAWHLLIGQS
jgi:hypothetical protein